MKRLTGRTYRYLVMYGFSAVKALEICIDARRGDRHACEMVRHVFALRNDFRGNDLRNLERKAYS